MGNKIFKGLKFPGMDDYYVLPEAVITKNEDGIIEIESMIASDANVGTDASLSTSGMAADAAAVGNALSNKASESFVLAKIAEAQLSGGDVDLSGYLTKENPAGVGSFSMNRKADSTIGTNSTTFGIDNIASGHASHAEGSFTNAWGAAAHAEGGADIIIPSTLSPDATDEEIIESWTMAGGLDFFSLAKGGASHIEGLGNLTTGYYAHAEGCYNLASNISAHAEGGHGQATGEYSHVEGVDNSASGYAAHAEGRGTIAASDIQHVQGMYNIKDQDDVYAHIVGNGDPSARSNAHTIDWNGNAWFAGAIDVEDKATTLSNIGAAPAGYGLGETNGRAITSWAEFDAATENGWYFLKNWTYGSHIMGGSGATKEQVASFISDFPEFAELGGNTITGLVFAQSIDENSGFQEFYPFTNGVVLRRARVAGVWQPFEWVNPLMLVGREYRTTKRYQGKAVYTKAINIGALPNNSTSSAKNLNTYGKRIVSAVLSLENPSDGKSCNVNTSNTSFTVAHSGDNWLWCSVKTTKDESAYNGILTIEYTKD